MKPWLFLSALAFLLFVGGCSKTTKSSDDPSLPTISAQEFGVLKGNWTGTLTYLDYSANKRVSIPAEATIESIDPAAVTYSISYPEEPWEDTKATFEISADGRVVNGHTVKEKAFNHDGTIIFSTEHLSEDNGDPVSVREVYVIGESFFSISKDVKPEGAYNYFNRNIYEFTR